MSTPALSANFTIPCTNPDGPGVFPSFILLSDSLTMTLSLKRHEPLTVFALDKLFLSHANSLY